MHYKLDQYIHLNSEVEEAVWRESSSRWTVKVKGKGTYECDILINAGGILNNPKYPNLKDLESFKGKLVHTAAWDPSTNVSGKRVAIVGAGASAIQVLPELQREASHIDIYIRTPSWISPPTGAQINEEHNHIYTMDEKSRFRDDPEYSLRTRKAMETTFNAMYRAFFKGSEQQQWMKCKLETRMKELIHNEELRKALIPGFEAGCRRINPGERYLDALQKQNVKPVFDAIQEVTPDGIVDTNGKERPVDILVAATGFDTSFRPRFPIIGLNGVDLRDLWKDDPVSYCGLAVSGFPNYLIFLGPNTPISNGSLIGALEATGDFFVRLIRKMILQQAASFNVRREVQSDFNSHTQDFMRRMVWTGSCRSWFKKDNGKVTAIWPGSGLHYREFLQSSRWEDFEWKYRGNCFRYWGLGFSEVEGRANPDLSYYIESHPNLPLGMLQHASDENENGPESQRDLGSKVALYCPEISLNASTLLESGKWKRQSQDTASGLRKTQHLGIDIEGDHILGVSQQASLSQVAAFST